MTKKEDRNPLASLMAQADAARRGSAAPETWDETTLTGDARNQHAHGSRRRVRGKAQINLELSPAIRDAARRLAIDLGCEIGLPDGQLACSAASVIEHLIRLGMAEYQPDGLRAELRPSRSLNYKLWLPPITQNDVDALLRRVGKPDDESGVRRKTGPL